MKTLLVAMTGMSLASLVALEAAAMIVTQGPIGTETGVSSMLVFQIGALGAAGWMLIKFGMLVGQWKRTLGRAAAFADAMTSLEDRMSRAEVRLKAHDEDMAMVRLLVQEHGTRLGIQKDPFKARDTA